MKISYNKLWNMLRNNKMKKYEFAQAAKISSYTMAKLNNNQPVNIEVAMNICKVFHCDIGDIMEIIESD